jgi:hypothetical protein
MPIHRTYEMSPDPPSMMGWDDYAERATAEWQAVLNSATGSDEGGVRDFLVRHPAFVPGAGGMNGPSGHEPCHGALLSGSPLREWVRSRDCYCDADGLKTPDFMWLAQDSDNLTPVLIEIGSPNKEWFTDSGNPDPDLVEAMSQFDKWRAWFNRRESAIAFYAAFDISNGIRLHGSLRPEFVLIYGREKEFQGRPELNKLRSQFNDGSVVMTFDRLMAARDCAGYICGSWVAERFRALSVPPTIRLGPGMAGTWSRANGLPEAIMKNEWISPQRKQFLVERLPYWHRWATSPKRIPYYVNLDDWE